MHAGDMLVTPSIGALCRHAGGSGRSSARTPHEHIRELQVPVDDTRLPAVQVGEGIRQLAHPAQRLCHVVQRAACP